MKTNANWKWRKPRKRKTGKGRRQSAPPIQDDASNPSITSNHGGAGT